MKTKKCTACGRDIQKHLVSCPYCANAKFLAEVKKRDAERQRLFVEQPQLFQQCGKCKKMHLKTESCPQCHPLKRPNTIDEIAGLVLGGLLVIGLPLFLVVRGCAPTTQEGDYRIDACNAAVQVVREQLKSPSTADFPGCWAGDYTIGSDVDKVNFVVGGYVDAENSFGAKLRTRYIVKLSRSGSSFSVTSVQIFQ
ncbi:MAG: hypothetical protein OSA97_06045 [Nevskia sp.]|nr:hypothetical protein [Nevskia sp.]